MLEFLGPAGSRLPKISFWLFVLGLLNLAAIPLALAFYPFKPGWDGLGQALMVVIVGIGIASFLGLASLIIGTITVRRHRYVLWWIFPLMIVAIPGIDSLIVEWILWGVLDQNQGTADIEGWRIPCWLMLSVPSLIAIVAWLWFVFKPRMPLPSAVDA